MLLLCYFELSDSDLIVDLLISDNVKLMLLLHPFYIHMQLHSTYNNGQRMFGWRGGNSGFTLWMSAEASGRMSSADLRSPSLCLVALCLRVNSTDFP